MAQSYEVVDARRKFTLRAAGDRLLVLLAVLARVRGAEFDLAVHAGEQ
jgi:hypothetical protein